MLLWAMSTWWGPMTYNQDDQLGYIGGIYSRWFKSNTEVEKWFLSTLDGWRHPCGMRFVTKVQLARPMPLRESYLMLSWDNHKEFDKSFKLQPHCCTFARLYNEILTFFKYFNQWSLCSNLIGCQICRSPEFDVAGYNHCNERTLNGSILSRIIKMTKFQRKVRRSKSLC